jgi:anthranilate synthase component I
MAVGGLAHGHLCLESQMIRPSLSEFQDMALQGNFIPVYKEFLGDLETPVSAYLKIRDKSFSYLLESADGGKQWGRYSFIGYQPLVIVCYRENEMVVRTKSDHSVQRNVSDPLAVLRTLSRRFKPVTIADLPPFQGGLVGYVNYDLIRRWERLPHVVAKDRESPEALFTIARRLIVFDHLTHRIMVVAFAHVEPDHPLKETYEHTCDEIEETISELSQPLSSASLVGNVTVDGLQANFSESEFERTVKKAKEYIGTGDVIQVVLSQEFSGRLSGDPFSLYRTLRSVNPSPYMFYFNFGDVLFIGASPENLVRLSDGMIRLRPIAGTRPRGKDQQSDDAFERDLLVDPKERAEHVMLVDLGRNDVGRVAIAGSVTVPRFMEVERYSHVMHIVSTIEGRLRPDADQFDLFRATFPAGTVTGSPKIRAMEIISELEPCSRGPYAGAAGYFGFKEDMDFCIVIRTITVFQNRLSFQVGAGIVADSVPTQEFQETLNKGEAMLQTIQKAGKE